MPYYFWGIDYTYIIFVVPALILAMIAQAKVSGTFRKYQKVSNHRGYTGADVARKILDMNGLHNVAIERIGGSLTDHYDPTAKVIRLSDAVYASSSVAALGVAAHETGHAIQHHTGYVPLDIRSSIFPAVNLGSKMAVPLVVLGLFVGYLTNSLFLAYAGLILFTFVVAFQLVTLPVEFNASSRAMTMLTDYGFLDRSEARAARKVLSAAALTYVAAAASSIITLLRLIAIVNSSRRND